MSKNMIFAQKLIKLLACQTCQNKKHPVSFKDQIILIYLLTFRSELIATVHTACAIQLADLICH